MVGVAWLIHLSVFYLKRFPPVSKDLRSCYHDSDGVRCRCGRRGCDGIRSSKGPREGIESQGTKNWHDVVSVNVFSLEEVYDYQGWEHG